MDPRNRADEALARARARGGFVVTPDNATSPMDAERTVRFAWDGANAYVEPATTPQHPIPQHPMPQDPVPQDPMQQDSTPQEEQWPPQAPSSAYQEPAQRPQEYGQFPPQPAQPGSFPPNSAPHQPDAPFPGTQPAQPPGQVGHPESQFLDARSAPAWFPAAEPGWPEEDTADSPALPPNPYQAQRGPGEFGPLGSQHDQPPQ